VLVITTYTGLKEAIVAWTKRKDLDAVVGDFVTLAEERIWKRLRARAYSKDLALPYTALAASVSLPPDCITVQSIRDTASGRVGHVNVISPDRFNELQINPLIGGVLTTQVMVTDREIIFAAVPQQTGALTGRYLARDTALGEAQQSNQTITRYPSIYLFACMVEAYGYLRNTDEALLYEARLVKAIDEANEQQPYNGQMAYHAPRVTTR
jgi:hypothetical protein